MFRFVTNVAAKAVGSILSPGVQNLMARPALTPISQFLIPQPVNYDSNRSLVKFSMRKGTRKTVKAVTKRFFRLHWGAWIRTRAGRHRHLWAKSPSRRMRLKEHVFCTGTQSTMLDRMVSEFWRRPKYYLDDPYAPYQRREEFYVTRRKPWRPEGWE